MFKHPLLLLFLAILCASCSDGLDEDQLASEKLVAESLPEKVSFTAEDGVTVHGNLYPLNQNSPVILLCHEAGQNRWEYSEIAFRLFDLGYNCLAIDQRNGGTYLDSSNLTRKEAIALGKGTTNLDALKDINAAIHWLEKRYKQKVLLWGSENSATLALAEGQKNEAVAAVIAFSPLRSVAGQDIAQQLSAWDKPLFVTSSFSGSGELRALMKHINHQSEVTQFVPQSEGCEGSCALLSKQHGHQEYWLALTSFLDNLP